MPGLSFIFILLTALVSSCDASLSQWDRVSLKVDQSLPASLGQLVVKAGDDIVTNVAFVREALVEEALPATFLWTSPAGDNLVFGSPDQPATSIAAREDGVFTVRVTARAASGEEGYDEFLLTWDTTGPVPSPSLKTLAGSLSGPDVRITSETTVVLNWGKATDALVGVRDYTLDWYRAASCVGEATTVPGLKDTFFTLTGGHGDVFSYRVRAVDELGQETVTGCSPSIRIDTVAPPPLLSFNGIRGQKLGEVELTLTLPADTSDYDRVLVRRVEGPSSPTDCKSGTLAHTLHASDLGMSPVVLADQTGKAGKAFSYRACIRDAAGNEAGVDEVLNIGAKEHLVFTSSATYAGSFLGGVTGAHQVCEALASQSSVSDIAIEPRWRAILSTSATHAKDLLQIEGVVLSPDGQILANDRADFWDGTVAFDMGTDENQDIIVVDTGVWTGTMPDGTSAATTCDDWSNGTMAITGTAGDVTAFNSQWLNDGTPSCDTQNRLYCISQF